MPPGYPHGGLEDAGRVVAYTTAVFFLGAAALHVSAAADHTNLPIMMVGFLGVAAAQAAFGGLLLWIRPARLALAAALALTLGVLGTWFLSRTAGLPFLPGGHMEPIGFKDGVTVVFELGSLPGLLLLWSGELSRLILPSPRIGSSAVVGASVAAFVLFVPALVLGGGGHHSAGQVAAMRGHAHAEGADHRRGSAGRGLASLGPHAHDQGEKPRIGGRHGHGHRGHARRSLARLTAERLANGSARAGLAHGHAHPGRSDDPRGAPAHPGGARGRDHRAVGHHEGDSGDERNAHRPRDEHGGGEHGRTHPGGGGKGGDRGDAGGDHGGRNHGGDQGGGDDHGDDHGGGDPGGGDPGGGSGGGVPGLGDPGTIAWGAHRFDYEPARQGENGDPGSGYAFVYRGPPDPRQGTVGHHSTESCHPTSQQHAAADRLYRETDAVLRRYDRRPDRALADGFTYAFPVTDRIIHMVSPRRVASPTILKAEEVESFLYVMTDRGLMAVAGMYVMPNPDTRGPHVGGCLTRWHRHAGLAGLVVSAGTMSRTPEMLHVWTYPGLKPYGHYDGRTLSRLWRPANLIPSLCRETGDSSDVCVP